MKNLIFRICLPLVMVMTAQLAGASDPLPVFVSILPQKYFVQQIGGDQVDVRVMVKPGASPATYEPKPTQMAALSKAKLYFSIGVPFETYWLKKIVSANPGMRVVHTDEGIHKIPMAAHEAADADAANTDHGHEGLDPHIWLSPRLVMVQATHILNALTSEDPTNKTFYTKNHSAFVEKITAMDKTLHELFKAKAMMRFMVFHPSWGYFARDYGLDMIPIEVEGKAPKPAQLKELIQHARENQIRVIFVQPQFSAKSAKLIAREIQGQVAIVDPLAQDWLSNLQTMADKFKEALK